MDIELNADLGESYGAWRMGNDEAMMGLISRANIACGFHGGDPDVMNRCVDMAINNNIAFGAHPSFNDLHGFGRRRIMGMTINQMQNMVLYQIGALRAIAQNAGSDISHVKYHGALSNMASEDDTLSLGLLSHLNHYDKKLAIMTMAKTALERQALFLKMPMIIEIYADRNYLDNGTLCPRDQPQAIIDDDNKICEHVKKILDEQAIISLNGVKIPTKIDSICVHSDHEHAIKATEKLHAMLENLGYHIKAY